MDKRGLGNPAQKGHGRLVFALGDFASERPCKYQET